MSLSKKLFERIARILSGIDDHRERFKMVDYFSALFAEENPRFDALRFSEKVQELFANRQREQRRNGESVSTPLEDYLASINANA